MRRRAARRAKARSQTATSFLHRPIIQYAGVEGLVVNAQQSLVASICTAIISPGIRHAKPEATDTVQHDNARASAIVVGGMVYALSPYCVFMTTLIDE